MEKWTARKLRALLKKNGWTYAFLARALNMSPKQVRNYALGVHPLSPKAEKALNAYLAHPSVVEARKQEQEQEQELEDHLPNIVPESEAPAGFVTPEMLRLAHLASGLNGQEAAEALGVSPGTFYAWRQGKSQPTRKTAKAALWAFYNKYKTKIPEGTSTPDTSRTRSNIAVSRVRELLESFAREEAVELNAMRTRLAVSRVAKTLNLSPRQVTEVVALTLAPLKDHMSAMEIYEILSGHSA